MIGSLPPPTNQQVIEQLEISLKYEKVLNEKYRQTIKEQKQLIKELDRFIKDNI